MLKLQQRVIETCTILHILAEGAQESISHDIGAVFETVHEVARYCIVRLDHLLIDNVDKRVFVKLLDGHALSNIDLEAVLEKVATLVAYVWWEGWRAILRLYHLHDLRSILAVLDPRWLPCQHLNDAAA